MRLKVLDRTVESVQNPPDYFFIIITGASECQCLIFHFNDCMIFADFQRYRTRWFVEVRRSLAGRAQWCRWDRGWFPVWWSPVQSMMLRHLCWLMGPMEAVWVQISSQILRSWFRAQWALWFHCHARSETICLLKSSTRRQCFILTSLST